MLSEGFGAGHTRAAHALSRSLKQLSPHIQTRVFELGSYLNPTIAPWIMAAYRKTVSARPRFMGMVYRYQYNKSINRISSLALHRLFYTHTLSIIRQLKPDIIVCTHPIPNAVISRLQRLGLHHIPLFTLITDYDAHATWITPEVHTYLISTPEVKTKMLQHGVPLSKIVVTGIPVHPDFWRQHNKEEIRARYSLKDMPTVLMMGGGWGLMNHTNLIEYMTRWRSSIQFIFCLGNNDKARKQLAAEPRLQHEHVHILGYTHEIDKLMEVSDLLITKPGGITCTEGLAKGIPMLFFAPLPGQEEENCHYFTEHGYGEPIHSFDTVAKWMVRLSQDVEPLRKIRQEHIDNLERFHPTACAEVILNSLGQETQEVSPAK